MMNLRSSFDDGSRRVSEELDLVPTGSSRSRVTLLATIFDEATNWLDLRDLEQAHVSVEGLVA